MVMQEWNLRRLFTHTNNNMKIRPQDSRHRRRRQFRWWEQEEPEKKFGRLPQLNKHGKVPHSQRGELV